MDNALRFILQLTYEFAVCFLATLFFAYLMRAPGKTPFASAAIGGLGYVFFRAFSILFTNDVVGCLVATLLIATAGEFFARRFKMPATVFVFPALIPLVPGFGLYRTMLALVQSDYAAFVENGAQTLFIAGSIAIPIAFVNIIARSISKFPKRNCK